MYIFNVGMIIWVKETEDRRGQKTPFCCIMNIISNIVVIMIIIEISSSLFYPFFCQLNVGSTSGTCLLCLISPIEDLILSHRYKYYLYANESKIVAFS